MLKFWIMTFVFSVGSTALSFKSDGKVHANWQAGANPRILVTVDSGFHVNDKAPNQLAVLPGDATVPPTTLEAKKVEFAVPPLKKNASVQISVYVCDDALTVCEPREWTWNARGQQTEGETAAAALVAPLTHQKPLLKEGFYQDNLPFALDQCGKEKDGRVLLLFSARWCPGCLRLRQEVWTSPEMKSTLDRFVKTKLDADRFTNRGIMDSYDVHAIPATLVLDCQGKEIDRLSDYARRDEMKRFLTAAAQPGLSSLAETKSKAEKGDREAALRLGERATWAYQPAEALKWFAKVPDREKVRDYWISAVNAAHDEGANGKDQALLKTTLEKAIAAFPRTVSALDWREELAELEGTESADGKKLLEEQVKICDEEMATPERLKTFAANEPAGDVEGFETFRVYLARGEALEKLHRDAEAKANWKAAVAEGKRLNLKDEPSGPFLRFIPILKKANENARLTKFFEKTTKGNHPDPDLTRRYARFLLEQGKTKQAVKVAKAAMDDSFDQNEIYAATLYAEALAKSGKNEEGREILRRYKARPDLTKRAKADLESAMNKIR